MFPETLETASLELRQFAPGTVDTVELYELFSSDRDDVGEVFEYVPQEPYETPKEARDQLADAASEWTDGESAQYGVYADGDLAGYTGLVPEWDRRTGRVGFILGRPYWGNGYAGEVAAALTELAFDRLDLAVVAIGYEAGNERSKRAVETFVDAVGGQYDGCLRNWTPLGDDVADHHRYTVTETEYREAVEE